MKNQKQTDELKNKLNKVKYNLWPDSQGLMFGLRGRWRRIPASGEDNMTSEGSTWRRSPSVDPHQGNNARNFFPSEGRSATIKQGLSVQRCHHHGPHANKSGERAECQRISLDQFWNTNCTHGQQPTAGYAPQQESCSRTCLPQELARTSQRHNKPAHPIARCRQRLKQDCQTWPCVK